MFLEAGASGLHCAAKAMQRGEKYKYQKARLGTDIIPKRV
jgi:hypothetical protein